MAVKKSAPQMANPLAFAPDQVSGGHTDSSLSPNLPFLTAEYHVPAAASGRNWIYDLDTTAQGLTSGMAMNRAGAKSTIYAQKVKKLPTKKTGGPQ